MLLWQVGIFKWPGIPQGPSGNWPSDAPHGDVGSSVWDSRSVAVFVSRPLLFCHMGGAWCGFLPFEFYFFRALRGYPPLPLSRVKDVFSLLSPFAASFLAYHREFTAELQAPGACFLAGIGTN